MAERLSAAEKEVQA
jgi:RNA exonuclease 1